METTVLAGASLQTPIIMVCSWLPGRVVHMELLGNLGSTRGFPEVCQRMPWDFPTPWTLNSRLLELHKLVFRLKLRRTPHPVIVV